MKNIMCKYFTANNTQKYIDVLPSMEEKYNNTYHRSFKLTPSRKFKLYYPVLQYIKNLTHIHAVHSVSDIPLGNSNSFVAGYGARNIIL